MRIAFVTPEFPDCGPSFGIGRYVRQLARDLHGLGIEVLVIACTDVGCFVIEGNSPPRLARSSMRAVIRPPMLARWLTAELNRWKPDVVEFSNWGGLGAFVAGPWLQSVRLSTPISKIRPRTAMQMLTRLLYRAWEHRTVESADIIIANSMAMSVLCSSIYGKSAHRVIPHGWDGPVRPPVTTGQGVLFVGRLEHRKGVDLLLAAWALVARRFPEAVLHLVGPDNGGFGHRTLAKFGARGVTVHGMVGNERDLDRIRRGCRIQVIPSRYESFGLVALEAWAGGQAVIASNVGGLAEVVDQAGALIEPGVRPLTESLMRLIQEDALCRALALAGSHRLASRFSAKESARKTVDAYHDALARRAGTTSG